MSLWASAAVGSFALAVLAGWLVPAWAMRMLMPALESSGRTVANYRGRAVAPGLGAVWAVWVACVALAASVWSIVASLTPAADVPEAWAALQLSPFALAAAVVPLVLPIAVFAFGLLDDVFGDAAAKGFRGHLRALREGRLTTGALKLFGIGFLALWSAPHRAVSGVPAGQTAAWGVAAWLLGAAVIALAANFANLTDLRPGRALKAYLLLLVPGLACAWAAVARIVDNTASTLTAMGSSLPVPAAGVTGVGVLAVAALAVGPVLAVWGYDLGERGMLGDAGANAMGALAGYLIVSAADLRVTAVAAAVLLALNLASERVSFSKVIDGNAALRWIDGLGRVPDTGAAGPARGAGGDGQADEAAGKDGGTSHR